MRPSIPDSLSSSTESISESSEEASGACSEALSLKNGSRRELFSPNVFFLAVKSDTDDVCKQ